MSSASVPDVVKAPAGESLRRLNDGLASVVDDARRSLVEVRSGQNGHGAGTIWHPDGLILTNAHVVRRHGLTVRLPESAGGSDLPATLLAADAELDLAALSVEGEDLPAITLGDSQALRPGDFVLALGHPWGVRGAATAGAFISMERPDASPATGSQPERPARRELMAVGLHLRPGHSGGPVVDASGRLVGINTMMAGPDVGVAVPVHVVKRFLRDALGT